MEFENCIPSGTQLDRYLFLKPVSKGGFSVVYLALDQETQENVIIKEYMPRSLAKRLRNHSVTPISAAKAQFYKKGRMLFFQETNILTTLKHPNIVNVINFFRANGTVYMVMEFEPGDNLQSYIKKKHKNGLSERFILTVFPALLEGLAFVHDSGYLHLDIKPANIHIRPGGKPLLIDFGSVHRRELSRLSQPGQVMTTGYAPIEQFKKTGYIGPWTDLYALGATMRSCLEGRPPIDARKRLVKDELISAKILFKKHCQNKLLEAIDWCLEVDPELRPQSIAELLEKLPQLETEQTKPTQWLLRLTGSNRR